MKIRVVVIPNSKKEGVSLEGDTLIVRVRKPARDGRANIRMIKLISKYFKIPTSKVVIKRGFKKKVKIVEVDV